MTASLSGGSVRVLWDADDTAEVTITGSGSAVWTVSGGVVTFPYTLSSSTTFETTHAGSYDVSVEHHGYEVASTPDGTRNVELRFGEQAIFSPTPDGTPNNKFMSDLHGSLAATYARKVQMTVASDGTGDYTTVSAAVAAVPAGGADIWIKRGTYTMSGVNIPARTTLRGEGEGTILKLANATNTTFLFCNAGADDVTFQDLTIDGNRANQTANSNCIYTVAARTRVINCHVKSANGYNIVGFPGATDMLVRGCITEDARDEGIEFQGVTRGSAVGNLVRGIGKNGIYAYANTTSNPANICRDITISGNVVEGSSALSANYAGIRVDDSAYNVTVSNNVVIGGGTGAYGISVQGQAGQFTRNVTVTGNTVRAVPGRGINVANATGTVVSANVVEAAGLSGIVVYSGASATTVTGNQVHGCDESGILIFNTTDFTVTGNLCRNNGQDQTQTNVYNGITLWNSSGTVDKGAIIGNRCYDDQGTKTQQYGIRTLNTIGASVVIGPNVVDGNATTGQAFSFGGATAASSPAWKKITGVTVSAGGNSIAHGLPYTPTSIVICMTSAGSIWKAGGSDATNIVLMADVSTRTCDVWVG